MLHYGTTHAHIHTHSSSQRHCWRGLVCQQCALAGSIVLLLCYSCSDVAQTADAESSLGLSLTLHVGGD